MKSLREFPNQVVMEINGTEKVDIEYKLIYQKVINE
jgi:hypothetical protein